MLGRRKTIFVGTSIMIVGAILQCTSFQLPQFIIGRLVTGFGNGLNTSTVPTWQSECSRAHRRGMLVMIEGALITCGIMIAYVIPFLNSFPGPLELLPCSQRLCISALNFPSNHINSNRYKFADSCRYWIDFGLYFTDPNPVSWRFPVRGSQPHF